jgi:hypothetical protein
MLAYVTTKFDDNFGCNIHQLQQSTQPRREARVAILGLIIRVIKSKF